MQASERSLLLETVSVSPRRRYSDGLSLIFAIICVVDVFGVFPVIALPKAVIDCGFYGILIIVIVCSVQIYTAVLLGKCWTIAEKLEPRIQRKNRYPYSALAEFTYGTTVSKFSSFLLDVTVFGGGIPNLIVASQNLELLGLRISNDTFYISYCYWMIITGGILCPILWLGSPKDMKLLCSISVSLVILVFLLVTGCLIISPATQTPSEDLDVPERSQWELILAAYGIISFQFDIHPSILTIQVDMREKSKLGLAVLGGFAASLGMFALVSLVAAAKFGGFVQPSILEALPTTIPLHFAALFVAIQLCLSSALSNSALYQHVEDCMQISRAFNHRRCILRTTLTLFAILIAESVPRFDLVMSLIGGSLTGPLVFILPPLFYLKMIWLESKWRKELKQEVAIETPTHIEETSPNLHLIVQSHAIRKFGIIKIIEILFCVAIIIVSAICTIATTYVNVTGAIKFANFSQPCIYNVSSALLNL